jgi:2,3-bisphosphoglycerate-dependent phosphoglycerate mutase
MDQDLIFFSNSTAGQTDTSCSSSSIEIDHAFTSVLKRASFSCNMALNTAQQHWVPVTKSWRLNERHYGRWGGFWKRIGWTWQIFLNSHLLFWFSCYTYTTTHDSLQGYNKDTAYRELGLDQELVMQMRRSYDVAPPRMEDDHPQWHGKDRRYRKLSPEQLDRSRAESLKDAADRIMPFYNSIIAPTLRSGNKCLIVSHANTIRTLIKNIDNISDEDIKGMSIPTGIPLLYRLDKDLKPVCPINDLEFRYMVEPKGCVKWMITFHLDAVRRVFLISFSLVSFLLCSYTWGTDIEHGFQGVYLGDLSRLQDIQRKRDVSNRNWQRIILYNIAKELHEDSNDWSVASGDEGTVKTHGNSESPFPKDLNRKFVFETRQLWFKLHEKMQQSEYGNMLLLDRMRDELEHRMHNRKQRFLTFAGYEELVNKLHLDAEGHVVEPFVALSEREDRNERHRLYLEDGDKDLEEEQCLIR